MAEQDQSLKRSKKKNYSSIVLEMPRFLHGLVEVIQDDWMKKISTIGETTNGNPKTP